MYAQADTDIFFFLKIHAKSRIWGKLTKQQQNPLEEHKHSLAYHPVLSWLKIWVLNGCLHVAVLLAPNSVPPAFALCQV